MDPGREEGKQKPRRETGALWCVYFCHLLSLWRPLKSSHSGLNAFVTARIVKRNRYFLAIVCISNITGGRWQQLTAMTHIMNSTCEHANTEQISEIQAKQPRSDQSDANLFKSFLNTPPHLPSGNCKKRKEIQHTTTARQLLTQRKDSIMETSCHLQPQQKSPQIECSISKGGFLQHQTVISVSFSMLYEWNNDRGVSERNWNCSAFGPDTAQKGKKKNHTSISKCVRATKYWKMSSKSALA